MKRTYISTCVRKKNKKIQYEDQLKFEKGKKRLLKKKKILFCY